MSFYKSTDLVGFLKKSNVDALFGNGWHCKGSIAAEEIPYLNNSIRVTVRVEITDRNRASNSDIGERVDAFVSGRLNDFERRYPGVLAELGPNIDIVIKKQ